MRAEHARKRGRARLRDGEARRENGCVKVVRRGAAEVMKKVPLARAGWEARMVQVGRWAVCGREV